MSEQAAAAGQAWHDIACDTLKHSIPGIVLMPPRALVIKG